MLGVAICFGVAILFLAKSYEVSEARDQMDPLVAVLKSNYWLSTHVVMITLGYMGGIVAACISHFYIIGRVFGIIEDKETRRYLTKIVYGMVAFTLLFSLIGTILGGIWAADSWGRFWGWDPKENGALMIVIWMLVILHARLGGYIKEMGLHVCSVFGFMIVVFSWWHVNFLGVGLHNYGFTSATAMGLIWTFYGMEFLIMLAGMVIAFISMEKQRANRLEQKLEEGGAENII
jgi:ABC-type transport system involved in cytochrome c biogenesis permease subunit